MDDLCNDIRKLVTQEDYQKCEHLLSMALGKYPNEPEPHNLLGIVLQKQGNHFMAMKHFRVAWALDPTYTPARQNLENFGTLFAQGKIAFNESDCSREEVKQEPSQKGQVVKMPKKQEELG
ncbi:MAG: hypothetical protein WCR02_07870 [Sphaerochaetaceae bacterium]